MWAENQWREEYEKQQEEEAAEANHIADWQWELVVVEAEAAYDLANQREYDRVKNTCRDETSEETSEPNRELC